MNLYSYSPQEKESVIELLAELYPKTFFVDPRQRRPLKNNIGRDILNEHNADVAPALLYAAVERYEQDFGYQYALQAGVKRINLQGQEIGTVTPQEHLNAQKFIRDRKDALQKRGLEKIEQLEKHVTVENKPVHGFNSKLPMTSTRLVLAKPVDIAKEEIAMPKPINDPLVPIQTLLDAVRGALTQPEQLRRPYLVAGLRVLVGEIENTINTIEQKD